MFQVFSFNTHFQACLHLKLCGIIARNWAASSTFLLPLQIAVKVPILIKALQHLLTEWLQENYGGTADNSVLDAGRRYSSRNEKNRINFAESEGGYCSVPVTEYMLRVHQHHQASK